jgi:hypothetical protein
MGQNIKDVRMGSRRKERGDIGCEESADIWGRLEMKRLFVKRNPISRGLSRADITARHLLSESKTLLTSRRGEHFGRP